MQEGGDVVTILLLCAARRMEASVCRGRQWEVGMLRSHYVRVGPQDVTCRDSEVSAEHSPGRHSTRLRPTVSTQKGGHECACSKMMVVELNGMRTTMGSGTGVWGLRGSETPQRQ